MSQCRLPAVVAPARYRQGGYRVPGLQGGQEQDRQDNLNGFKNNVVKCSVDQTWEDVIRKSARQVMLKYPKLKLSKLSGGQSWSACQSMSD